MTYGLIEAPTRGWGDPVSLSSWIAGVLLLIVFARWELRRGDNALMNMRLWRVPPFGWGTAVLSAATMLGMVALFATPLYLEGVLGMDAMGSGIRLTPMVGGIIAGVVASVVLCQQLGYKPSMVLGLLGIALGSALATRTSLSSGYGWAACWLICFGFGFGALMVSCQNLALSRLDQTTAGAGSATVQVMRQTGSVVGIAVLISVLNSVYRSRVDTHDLPASAASAVRDSFQAGLVVAQRLNSPKLAASVKAAFLDGMAAQMWIGVALSGAVAVLVIMAMPNQGGEAHDTT